MPPDLDHDPPGATPVPAALRGRAATVAAVYTVSALLIGSWLIVLGLGRIATVVPKRPVYDLVVDWSAARAFAEGYTPYTKEGMARAGLTRTGFGHPPTANLWMVPLARFDLVTARTVLDVFSLLLLLIELVLLAVELRVPCPAASAWLALGLVLLCDFVDYHAYVGQISQIIAFTYFSAWYCLRRGWEVRAGLAVGAACTLKAFPGVLFLLLVLGRRWRAAVTTGAVYLVIAVIMTSRFGLASWSIFLAEQAETAGKWMGSIQNIAVHGVVLRFFHPVCGPRGGLVPAATAVSVALSLALLAAVGWLGRRSARARGPEIDVPFAAAAALSVFTANWAWEHYFFILLVPWFLMARALWDRRLGGAPARVVAPAAAVLVSGALAMGIPILVKASLQNAHAAAPSSSVHLRLHLFEALNVWPGLSLVMLTLAVLWWDRPRAPPGAEPMAPPAPQH